MSAAQVEEGRERGATDAQTVFQRLGKVVIKRRQSVRLFKRGRPLYLQRAGGTRPDRGRRTIVLKRRGRGRGERGVHGLSRTRVCSLALQWHPLIHRHRLRSLFRRNFLSFFLSPSSPFLFFPFLFSFLLNNSRGEESRRNALDSSGHYTCS